MQTSELYVHLFSSGCHFVLLVTACDLLLAMIYVVYFNAGNVRNIVRLGIGIYRSLVSFKSLIFVNVNCVCCRKK